MNMLWKNRMRRALAALLALLACFLLPAAPARAEEPEAPDPDEVFSYPADFENESLGEVFERYISERAIDRRYIAIGWYDLESGEEWYLNPDLFQYAGSTYKLPFAMLYMDRVADGELSLDERIGSCGRAEASLLLRPESALPRFRPLQRARHRKLPAGVLPRRALAALYDRHAQNAL